MLSQISFDPTISLGSLVAGGMVVVSMLGSLWKLLDRIKATEVSLGDVRRDVAEMKPKVDLILVHQVQLQDGSNRMDRIEGRVDRLETRKA